MKEDNPSPGSPEYDEMMAAKYRSQGRDRPLTDDGTPASNCRTTVLPDGATVSVHRESTLGPANKPLSYSAEAADPGQVFMVEKDIEALKRDLAREAGRNPRTGEPIPWFTGQAREAMEKKLAQLEQVTLPHAKAQQREAAEWRAANVPTAEQKLRDEQERRTAVQRRAEQIADEQEAEALAQKIKQQRRSR